MLKTTRVTPRRTSKPTPRIKPGRVKDPAYLAKVASLPCCVCGAHPVEVHHIRTGCGMGQKAGDDQTLPLCPRHHRTGPDAFHAGPGEFQARHGSEAYLVEQTRLRLEMVDWPANWKSAEWHGGAA